ncbi:AAA family ATPase [Pseudomonas sp. App30]|uniref:trifunctional serine/threonine-protein kinase/ATP-binding protein/sensor histidine kinase n=1 Tax=Pseudomonas sp. App30 TaxID=3068990 RepID=UPI003A803ACC
MPAERVDYRQQLGGFNEQWLKHLTWRLLLVDGEVARYRVRSPISARDWLIARPAALPSEGGFRRLHQEFDFRHHLHPGWAIVPVALISAVDGPLLVLDDSQGRGLHEVMGDHLSILRFLRLALGATHALGQAHRAGILHRDIKPCNLVEGADGHVRLMAFSLACQRDAPVPAAEAICGSFAYMSPEQGGRVGHEVDERSDLYALGVSFYEMLTGQLPFEGNDPVEWLHQHLALQPAPLESLRPAVPPALTGLVFKLLAKRADERYADTDELAADLRLCLAQWTEFQGIHPFEPGARGSRAHGVISAALPGRQRECAVLHDRVLRCAVTGEGERVLLSGPLGSGKTALVRQVHQDLVAGSILFAVGRFDHAGLTTPYAAVSTALRSLVLRVLGEHPEGLAQWRSRLLLALGDGVAPLLALVPELALVLGQHAPVPEPARADGSDRLQSLLRACLAVFGRPGTPLLLFFDNTQGLDSHSLALLHNLVEVPLAHVVLVLASRDSAPGSLAQAVKRGGGHCTELALLPLEPDGVLAMVNGLLGSEGPVLLPLAEVIHAKSGGNPLFIQQLVRTLLEEKRLVPRPGALGWAWDQQALEACPVADNVVDLLLTRMARLPRRTRWLLGLLALIGTRADLAHLARLGRLAPPRARLALGPAVQAGLLLGDGEGWCFSHDRVRDTAYHAIAPRLRALQHTRLAHLLIQAMDDSRAPGYLFRIALHIQQCAHEQLQEADLRVFVDALLRAAQRARDSSTLPFALQYLRLARELAGCPRWVQAPQQRDAMDMLYAQCLMNSADYAGAHACIDQILDRADSLTQVSALYVLKIEALSLADNYAASLHTGRAGLALFGIEFSGSDRDQPRLQVSQALGDRPIDALLAHQAVNNSFIAAALELMAAMIIPAIHVERELALPLLARMLQMTVRHGVSPASVPGLAWFGVLLADEYGAYEEGQHYVELAVRLEYALGLETGKVSTQLALGRTSAWTRSLAFSLECGEQAFAAGRREGRAALSCYACHHMVSILLVMGGPLERVAQRLDAAMAVADAAGFADSRLLLEIQQAYVRGLRDADAPARGNLLQAWQPRVEASRMLPIGFFYWLYRGMLAFTQGRHEAARDDLARAAQLKGCMAAHVHLADLACYSALNHAALAASAHSPLAAIQGLQPPLHELRRWAQLNPQAFLGRELLVEAEIARLQGDLLRALQLLEAAIEQAAASGCVPVLALAHERAANCHQALGLASAARSHRFSARDAYQRWGASGKVAALEAGHLYLNNKPLDARASIDMLNGQQYLDLVSVTKASQALSREIVFERLVETLLANTIVHAGARNGALILVEGGDLLSVASGATAEAGVRVTLCQQPVQPRSLPLSLLYTVMRTGRTVALEQAGGDAEFADDPYFAVQAAGAVLCLPLLKQGEVIGLLYLENALACGVFSHPRVAMIELLAAQAAISLETARLYAQVLEENARRRDTEAQLRTSQALLAIGQKIIRSGSFRWDVTSDQSQWSDELFAVWGLPVAATAPAPEVLARRVHADDAERFNAQLQWARQTRLPLRMAFRISLDDGAVRHLEAHAEPAEDGVYVGVTTDVSERRATEAALRSARAELAQVRQSTVMGELAASIAHEINQPLASIVTNASASVRWLQREVPQVGEALEGLRDIARDGRRAADIIRALQALARQEPASRSWLQIDELITQVLRLLAVETDAQQVTVHTALQAAGVQVQVDGVQLQQVLYNLVANAVEAMASVPAAARRLQVTSNVPVAGQLVVMVEDSGPGIGVEDEGKVFNAFFTTKANGMGMGLAICRSIMDAQGGTLHLHRGRQGQTVFVFTLPCAGLA